MHTDPGSVIANVTAAEQDYISRKIKDAPPLSEAQKAIIRQAFAGYTIRGRTG